MFPTEVTKWSPSHGCLLGTMIQSQGCCGALVISYVLCWSHTRACPHQEGIGRCSFFTWLVARKSSPSQRGHQRCLPIIREPVMWNARQSLCRPWVACLPYVWPSRLRSRQPMLSLCRRIPGRRRLFLCASRLALCQPMSDVSFPIARPNAVRRSRCQGCSHAVGRS